MVRRKTELFGGAGRQRVTFPELLGAAQKFMSDNYSDVLSEENSPQKQEKMLAYIKQYLSDQSITADGMEPDVLALRLYNEMAEYSFLTPFLNGSNTDWEEININRWDDAEISYCKTSLRVCFHPVLF